MVEMTKKKVRLASFDRETDFNRQIKRNRGGTGFT